MQWLAWLFPSELNGRPSCSYRALQKGCVVALSNLHARMPQQQRHLTSRARAEQSAVGSSKRRRDTAQFVVPVLQRAARRATGQDSAPRLENFRFFIGPKH
jgi:hypothetical protein